MKFINSNPIDKNGSQITEGSTVLFSDPSRYESFGEYIVDAVVAHWNGTTDVLVSLLYKDGSRPNYDVALPNELTVLTRQ